MTWKSGRADWRAFQNACGPYTGPELAYKVFACTAPDGTHWALQAWMREVKNYGGVSDCDAVCAWRVAFEKVARHWCPRRRAGARGGWQALLAPH